MEDTKIAKGSRKFLPLTEKKEIFNCNAIAVQVPHHVSVSRRQIRNLRNYDAKKTTPKDWEMFVEDNYNQEVAKVIGHSFDGDSRVVVVSSDGLMSTVVNRRCVSGFLTIDGSVKHVKKIANRVYTILMLGTQDIAHQYHPFAWAVISSNESEQHCSSVINIIDDYCSQHGWDLDATQIMTDGSKGMRNAMRIWSEEKYGMSSRIAMCFYHMIAAIKLKVHMFQNKEDHNKAVAEIHMMADAGFDFFEVAWRTIRVEWLLRGWHEFIVY